MSGLFRRATRSGAFGAAEALTRQTAIESFQNIADFKIDAPSADPELAEIEKVLRSSARPVSVADVAAALNWNSTKAAEALSRGGKMGRWRFAQSKDAMTVELP